MIIKYQPIESLKPFKILDHLKIRNIKSKEIKDLNKIFNSNFIQSFIHTCEINNGIGLCASQIGRFINFLIVKREPFENNEYYVIINPKYKPIQSEGKSFDIEGCLSVKGKREKIERWNQIEVESDFYNQDSGLVSRQIISFTKLESRIFLHEYDHLFGKDILLKSK